MTRELAAARVTDPAAVRRLLSEPAIIAAVDLTNQVRYLQEDSGPCEGCARPEPSGREPGQGPDEPEPDIVGG